MRATIRLYSLVKGWETVGVDRLSGVVHENLQVTANTWGADKASFDLKRETGYSWPDLKAFTPVEIEVDGIMIFTGRIVETPTTDNGNQFNISVQLEGIQYELDDDLIEYNWVYTNLSGFKNMMDYPSATIGNNAHTAVCNIENNGAITISYPQGVALTAGSRNGVVLDLGNKRVKKVVVDWQSSNNTAGLSCYMRAADGPTETIWTASGGYQDAASFALNGAGASGTVWADLTRSRRYLQIFIHNPAFTGTTGAEYWIKITGVRLFGESAWESGNQSILKATDVIKKARDLSRRQISSSNTQIATTSFNIPELYTENPRTARDIINGVNAYHNYITMIDNNNRLVFSARPTAPLFEVGDWADMQFDDASANSGDDIFNRVLLSCEGPDSQQLLVERYTSYNDTTTLFAQSDVTLSNATFASNANNYSRAGSATAITRDTGTYQSSPASGSITIGSDTYISGATSGTTWATGTFYKGKTYVLEFYARASAATTITVTFGSTVQNYSLAATTWTRIRIAWSPQDDVAPTASHFRVEANMASGTFWIDTMALYIATPTLLDSRGIIKTKQLSVGSALTQDAAVQICDTYLAGHKTTQLRGTLTIKGDNSIRIINGGSHISPATILTKVNQMIRLSDRIDPDTGGIGRDATMVSATWTEDSNSVQIALDNTRSNFEALLERLSVITSRG